MTKVALNLASWLACRTTTAILCDITMAASLVRGNLPNCDMSKGSSLIHSCQYIIFLKESDTNTRSFLARGKTGCHIKLSCANKSSLPLPWLCLQLSPRVCVRHDWWQDNSSGNQYKNCNRFMIFQGLLGWRQWECLELEHLMWIVVNILCDKSCFVCWSVPKPYSYGFGLSHSSPYGLGPTKLHLYLSRAEH